MKLAITGGTGFVGSHLIDAALAAGPRGQGADPPRPAAARPRSNGSRAISTIAHAIHQLVQRSRCRHPRRRRDQRARRGRLRRGQCRRHAGDARRRDRRRRPPLRPRLLARRARAQAVALRRVEGPRRGAGRKLGPRLGDRPPARGLRPRRQGDARAVPDGQARPGPAAAQGPRVADPRRRSRPPAARAGRARRAHDIVIEPDDGTPGGWSHQEFAQRSGHGRWPPQRQPVRAAPVAPPRRPARPARSAATGPSSPPTAPPISPTPTGSSIRSRAPPPELWQPAIETNRTASPQPPPGIASQGWL